MTELNPPDTPSSISTPIVSLADGRVRVLCGICILAIAGAFFVPPIAQDPVYHQFADPTPRLGIQNFWNVASNLPFVLFGLFGLLRVSRLYEDSLRAHYLLFCAGTVLIGLGSAYYHLAPATDSLVWDRLPMTVVFMALFAMVVSDRISPPLGRRILLPLVLLGVLSVGYWYYTEMNGNGDLRPYALVQFLPMALIPLMLGLFKGRGLRAPWLWATLVTYVLAKLVEHFDGAVLQTLQVVSGHSVKHVLAAIAVLFAVFAMHRARTT